MKQEVSAKRIPQEDYGAFVLKKILQHVDDNPEQADSMWDVMFKMMLFEKEEHAMAVSSSGVPKLYPQPKTSSHSLLKKISNS